MIDAILTALAKKGAILLPAFVGGLVDYLNQLQAGRKSFRISGLLIHLVSALFFGWAVGVSASELNYSADLVSVAGGAGGFLGVRVADLVAIWVSGDRRRK